MAQGKALLIFDIDGTLLQTHTVTVPAVRSTFAAYGLEPPADDAVCRFFGRPVEEYETWLKSLCPFEIAENVLAATNTAELECLVTKGRLYGGVPDMLETLSLEGYALAICSNGPESYVQAFVTGHGLAHHFQSVYARGNRYSDKVEMVGRIRQELAARPVVCIGDRHDDIDAAHAWGGYAIAAAYGYGDENEWRHADAVVLKVHDIPAKVKWLADRCRIGP